MAHKKKVSNVRVIKNAENPETPEILAQSLITIADSFERLMGQKEGLKQNAIVALLANMPGMVGRVSKTDIDFVLINLTRLKSYYVRNEK